jgi:hypothetical protein
MEYRIAIGLRASSLLAGKVKENIQTQGNVHARG